MDMKMVAAALVVVIIVIAVTALYVTSHGGSNSPSGSTSTTGSNSGTQSATGSQNTTPAVGIAGNIQRSGANSSNSGSPSKLAPTPYAGSQYASVSYQIYPSTPLNATGLAVTSDFNVTQTMVTGGTSLKLRFFLTNTNYTVMVPTGSRLYFIDKNPGDDAGTSGDHYSGDDGYMLVNASGYITSTVFALPST